MDPNANLAEQNRILERNSVFGKTEIKRNRARLAELRAALADWIAGGGFAPTWRDYPRAAWYFGR